MSAVGKGNVGVSVLPTARDTLVAEGVVQRRAVQSQVVSPIFTVKLEYWL